MKLILIVLSLTASVQALALPSVCDVVFSNQKFHLFRNKRGSVFVVSDQARTHFLKARKTKRFKNQINKHANRRIDVEAGELDVFYEMGMTAAAITLEQTYNNFFNQDFHPMLLLSPLKSFNYLYVYKNDRLNFTQKLKFGHFKGDADFWDFRNKYGMTQEYKPQGFDFIRLRDSVNRKEFALGFKVSGIKSYKPYPVKELSKEEKEKINKFFQKWQEKNSKK